MNRDLLKLYSDYLLGAFGHTTATGLSAMADGEVSHDKVTCFLSEKGSRLAGAVALGKAIGARDRREADQEEEKEGVLVVDDTIEEKPYTELQSELICWHYDHSKGRNLKGINLLSVLYRVGEITIPVAFELIKKSEWVFNEKKARWQRKSPLTKNELYRKMLRTCQKNRVNFTYVLNEVWYASSENMAYITRRS